SALLVPNAFDSSEMQLLRTAARDDPRLRAAADHAEQGQITQYLAGAPAVLERYVTAPPAPHALITAAMDLRRLGCGLTLSSSLLRAAAVIYLPDIFLDHAPKQWFEEALVYACAPCRGARGPLRQTQQLGENGTDVHSLQLADYLDQHGRRERGTTA